MKNLFFKTALLFLTVICITPPLLARSASKANQSDNSKETDDKKTEIDKKENDKTTAAPVTDDSTNWVAVKPTGAAAEFKMPVKPRFIERSFTPVENQPPIKVRLHIGSFNEGSGAFVVSYHDLHAPPADQLEIDNTLNGAIVGSIANVQGKPVSQQVIRYGEYPGRAYTYLYAQNDQIHQVSARAFLVGKRQYQISALMKQDAFDEKIANAFLDTFRILEPEPAPSTEKSTGTEDGHGPVPEQPESDKDQSI